MTLGLPVYVYLINAHVLARTAEEKDPAQAEQMQKQEHAH